MNLRNWQLSSIDWILLIPVFILVVIGLSTLLSIDTAFFKSQLIFLFLCVGVFFVLSQFDVNVLKRYALPVYLASIFLLGVVLVVGIESRGSVRWLEFLGLRIQFSEILKPFLAISLAHFLSSDNDYSLRKFVSAIALLFPIVFLIFLQPDLGNALIYLIATLIALLIYGFPFKYFILGFIGWLVTLPFFWLILHDYQKQRLLTFVNPNHDPLGSSYNAIQSLIAVGSGMFLGKGFGQATQATLKFLPENHTDFIFATISESLGFVGSMIVLICFVCILYRIFLMVFSSQDRFSKNFTLIAFSIIFTHFFINIGMNIGLVPVVGVTLPFVSYGGSSLLANFILLGLLAAVNKKRDNRKVLEIR